MDDYRGQTGIYQRLFNTTWSDISALKSFFAQPDLLYTIDNADDRFLIRKDLFDP
jgi:hypothetical protein